MTKIFSWFLFCLFSKATKYVLILFAFGFFFGSSSGFLCSLLLFFIRQKNPKYFCLLFFGFLRFHASLLLLFAFYMFPLFKILSMCFLIKTRKREFFCSSLFVFMNATIVYVL